METTTCMHIIKKITGHRSQEIAWKTKEKYFVNFTSTTYTFCTLSVKYMNKKCKNWNSVQLI